MKHPRFAHVVVAASVLSFGASFAAQHGHTQDANCQCVADATYHPGSWGGINCSGTFGVSWTRTQDGMCSQPPCTAQPCKGEFTVSATGGCSWLSPSIDLNPDFPTVVGGSSTDWSAGPYPYSLDCGRFISIHWMDDATHTLKCKGCD